MKSPVPVLAPLLRSDAQGELLALLFLHPDEEYSLTEISRRVATSLPTVHAEVERLVANQWVTERRVGHARLISARTDQPLYRPLSELLDLTYGPTAVLPELLVDLSEVREAFIYGSWAARRLGQPGPPPRDIDVVVIGRASRKELAEASDTASRRLRRDVNITRITPEVWDAGQDPFVKTLQSRPLVRIAPAGPAEAVS